MLGMVDQARNRLKEELEGARILAHPYMWDFSNNAQSFFFEALGDPDITEVLARELKRNSEEHNITYGLVLSIIHLGWVISCQGQLEEGITQMQQGLSAVRSVDFFAFSPLFSTLLIDAYRRAKKPEQCLEVLYEAKELIDTTDERYYEAELHRLEGELLLLQGADDIVVENSYSRAIEVARSQSGKLLELRATVSLARLWQSQGREAVAYENLSEIYNWFTEGFDTKDLREAKSLLDELSAKIHLESVG
jgi:predicted ATPase